jgi:hypothetical protein
MLEAYIDEDASEEKISRMFDEMKAKVLIFLRTGEKE